MLLTPPGKPRRKVRPLPPACALFAVFFLFCGAAEAFDTDNRYEILDELEESFRTIREKKWVKNETKDQLILAQKLFEMKSTDEGLIPSTMNPHLQKDYLDSLRRADSELEMEGFLPEDRLVIRESIHRDVVAELLRRINSEKRFSFSLRDALLHNSNITQTPESTVEVSNAGGTLMNAAVSARYTGRSEPFGKPSVGLEYALSEYRHDRFANRDSKSATLSLNDKFIVRKSGISFFSFGADLRADYLRSFGKYSYAFTTYVPKLELMLAPFAPKDGSRGKKLSDLFFTFLSVGDEIRDYTGVHEIDSANGRKKDSNTPFLTLIFLSLKTWKSHPSRTSLSIMFRNQTSDSNEFAYSYYRLGLGYTVPWPKWSVGAEIAYSVREQDSYHDSERNDTTWEPRANLSAKLYKEILSMNMYYTEVHQRSNRSDYNYLSRQVSAGLVCNF